MQEWVLREVLKVGPLSFLALTRISTEFSQDADRHLRLYTFS